MCTSPIHLTRRASFVPNRLSADGEIISSCGKYAYDVPCGKCEECKQSKRDSLLVRCLSEYGRCNQRACFVTLTYNNKNLPYIDQLCPPVFSPEGEVLAKPKKYHRSVWNKVHIQKFLKSLNEHLIYYIGTEILGIKRLVTVNGRRCISSEWRTFLDNQVRPLKYLVVCERGKSDIYLDDSGRSRKGTSRPHYHAVVFIQSPLLSDKIVLDKIKELWSYGHSYNIMIGQKKYNGTPDRDFIQSFKYVCKYVTKDMTDISETLLYSDHSSSLVHKPFCLISNFLGDNLLDNLSDNEILHRILNGITIPDVNYDRVLPVPRYNILKSPMYVRYKDESFISSRYSKPEVFVNDFTPIFIDTDELEYHIYTRYRTLLTPFGVDVSNHLKTKKSAYYVKLLKTVQSLPSSFTHISKLSYSKCDVSSLSLILDTDPVKFKNFVSKLYEECDDSLECDSLYVVYSQLRKYSETLIIMKRKERDIRYKNNLDSAIVARPELFNVNPL